MCPDDPKRPSQMASFEDLFLRLRDAALLLDAQDFSILDCNDSCETILGTPAEELAGKSLSQWISPEKREEFEKILRVTRRRYHPKEWDVRIERSSAPAISVRVSACMLKLHDGRETVQVLLRDITEEIEAQKKIREYISQLEILNKRLETLSTTDAMTQLFNFRHFDAQLRNEHVRCSRYSGVYSLVFIDVDHFKHYNDTNGHPAGDEILRTLASIIQKSCRDTDLPARYGGEEFVVLCPEVEWQNALVLAERIFTAVEKHPFPYGESQPLGRISISVGVASYPADGLTAQAVLDSADKAVYHSKHTGRARITASHDIKLADVGPKKA